MSAPDAIHTSEPRFQRAAAYSNTLRVLAASALAIAVVALGLAHAPGFIAQPHWRAVLATAGAAFLVFATHVLAAYWIASWRARVVLPRVKAAPARSADTRHGRALQRIRLAAKRLQTRIPSDVVRSLALWVLAAIAMWMLARTLDFELQPIAVGRTGYLVGGALLLLAFGVLVMERYLASAPRTHWPEAALLALIARAVIATLVMSAAGALFASADRVWPVRLLLLAGLFPGIIALETAMRAFFAMFVRPIADAEPRMLGASALSGVLRWPPRPLRSLQEELRQRFGIDLRQTWALAYVRSAVLPVCGGIAIVAWLASGLREVPIDARAVHERFGEPVAVWQPGIHIGLPWPFSRTRLVENGVVHELAAMLSTDEEESGPATVDGPAPESANRLWDASHVSENSQVIASTSDERQSFHIVNMDVRFIYRIALTDEAALAVTYGSADVPSLIRSTAGRVLVRDFASRTLAGLLGESRTALAATIHRAVQTDLASVGSGVEILATLIEAVHPPAGAANAYHSVQAAQIKTQATLARERGRTAQQVNDAHLQARLLQDKASATAREAVSQAQAAKLKFDADRTAHRSAGKAFVLEQYLTQLAQGLTRAELIVLDHRLKAGQAPTIDLRAYPGGGERTAGVAP